MVIVTNAKIKGVSMHFIRCYAKLNLINMIEQIIEKYYEEEFLKADGFDDAIIGVEKNKMRLIYSVSKCLKILEQDMTELDAMECFTFNVSAADDGDKTPIWCWDNFA